MTSVADDGSVAFDAYGPLLSRVYVYQGCD